MACPCCSSSQAAAQQDALQAIVGKHVTDPALRELSSSQTSTERGVHRWDQVHLVSALDVINEYQRNRKARLFTVSGHGLYMDRSYKDDPRTRMCELVKSWLRANAGSSTLSEEDVRNMNGLCRDILNHPELFQASNPQSFLMTMADVYDHLQWQLQEVLESDRSCADLSQRVLSFGRNLVSDTLTYLLLAPTDLQQMDAMPSLEVVKLWQSLPNEGHPLPSRKDPSLQKNVGDAWSTHVGSMLAALLKTPFCVRLFANADAERQFSKRLSEVLAVADDSGHMPRAESVRSLVTQISRQSLHSIMQEARADFSKGHFSKSALAGALRGSDRAIEREYLLQALLAVFDITYLLGEVMVHFHRISDGLGDYGMIRVASWLHPFLDALVNKVQLLKRHLGALNKTLDAAYVLGRCRGWSIRKPAPSVRMCARARVAIERAVIGRNTHADQMVQTIDELRARSAPERLPHVAKELDDACETLQDVLGSAEFREHVGDSFPELPALGGITGADDTADIRPICDIPQQPYAPLPPLPVEPIVSEALPQPESIDELPESIDELSAAPATQQSVHPFDLIASAASSDGDSSVSSSCSNAQPASVVGKVAQKVQEIERRSSTQSKEMGARAEETHPATSTASSMTSQSVHEIERRSSTQSKEIGARAVETHPATSTASLMTSQSRGFRTEVHRLVASRGSFRKHDSRALEMHSGVLLIYDKGSRESVKSRIELPHGVDRVYLRSDTILEISVSRPPPGFARSSSSLGLGRSFSSADGVREPKDYAFEFPTPETAKEFYEELSRQGVTLQFSQC